MVKKILLDLGINPTIHGISGNIQYRNVYLLDNIFNWNGHYYEFIGEVPDHIDRAIGAYEAMLDGNLEINSRQVIDIENAIERALRPCFRSSAPENEKVVQDAVETILRTLGVEFLREKESVTTGAKSSTPDFTIESEELAIEVKYSRDSRKIAILQEEMNADVAAYRVKWRRVLFIVYDNGLITDPHAFKLDNIRLFGVSVVVVKH